MDSPNQSISYQHNAELIENKMNDLMQLRTEHDIFLEETIKKAKVMSPIEPYQPSLEGVPL